MDAIVGCASVIFGWQELSDGIPAVLAAFEVLNNLKRIDFAAPRWRDPSVGAPLAKCKGNIIQYR